MYNEECVINPLQNLNRSLIEEDSDYWTIHSLSPQIWNEVVERKDEWQWTDLM